jgi:hypothetical protein
VPVTLDEEANEESTYVLSVSFADENGDPVTPNAGLTWSLTDLTGNVINAREDVALTPATSVTIVLSDADLALPDRSDPLRVVTLEGTYNSSLGNNLPLKDEARFKIRNLVKVKAAAG